MLNELIEIRLREPDDFLKVRETLTRIGVASKKNNTLYQSCHIFHRQGKYYIVHFKQMFLLDGKQSDFSEEDRARLNTIVNLLSDWGLIEVVDVPALEKGPFAPIGQIKIVRHKDVHEWNLVAKYTIGKAKTFNRS